MNMKKATAALLASIAAFGIYSTAEARPESPSCRESKLPYKLGIARYTMHKRTFDQALEMLLLDGMIKEGAEEDETSGFGVSPAEHQIMQAEIILIINDAFLRNGGHDPAGEGGVIKILKELGAELEIQGGGLRRGTRIGQHQILHPVGPENRPQDILQIHQDHRDHLTSKTA